MANKIGVDMNERKIVTFCKINNEKIMYAVKAEFDKYMEKTSLCDAGVEVVLSNEDIDKLITALTELKEK